MGWCSATGIFDRVAGYVLDHRNNDDDKAVEVLKVLADAMEVEDWDCQQDSQFYDHPLVRRVFRELHPDWEELQEPPPMTDDTPFCATTDDWRNATRDMQVSAAPLYETHAFTLSTKRYRVAGSAKGHIVESEDFDEPLDDFAEM